MKADDLATMTVDQLDDELVKLKKEQFNLRFQRATGQLENTARFRQLRRDIARINTVAVPKRILQGVVVSDKSDKTIVVKVERRFTHPLLKKTVRRSKKYKAHDETNQRKVGELVSIEETKPISKDKTWIVVENA